MWEIFLKPLAVRLSLPSPRPPHGQCVCPRWGQAAMEQGLLLQHPGTESQPHNSRVGRDPPRSIKQVSPIHSSAGTSHRVSSLSDPSSHQGERMFSTSLSKGHGHIQDSSPAFSKFSLQRKWFKSYWQTPGRTTSRRLQLSVFSPLPWKSHLVLKQTTLSQHPCASRRDRNSPTLSLMKWQNFWCKQWNQTPIRCYSLAQLFVPAEEAINWWWIGARAREAMIYQHLQCQCSSTSSISTAKENWPILGSQVIFKNWRNRRPPRHLKKNTNHMKNLSFFSSQKSRGALLNLSLHKLMTIQETQKKKTFPSLFSALCQITEKVIHFILSLRDSIVAYSVHHFFYKNLPLQVLFLASRPQ